MGSRAERTWPTTSRNLSNLRTVKSLRPTKYPITTATLNTLVTGTFAAEKWYSEISDFDFNRQEFQKGTGEWVLHFLHASLRWRKSCFHDRALLTTHLEGQHRTGGGSGSRQGRHVVLLLQLLSSGKRQRKISRKHSTQEQKCHVVIK